MAAFGSATKGLTCRVETERTGGFSWGEQSPPSPPSILKELWLIKCGCKTPLRGQVQVAPPRGHVPPHSHSSMESSR